MVITKLALPRRTFLRGMGATLALPLLDAMVPALSARAPGTPRFAAVYVGNGMNMWDWTPPTEGKGFELSPILQPMERFRRHTLVLSGLDNYPATDQGDTGGQHPRAAPAFMSSVHPKQTEGADVEAGTTVDQMIAELICRDSKLPSLEVSVDRNDVVGACDHGYACAYMNSMSWKTPTQPLPAETNPRFVFERLFGTGDTPEERQLRVEEDRSILDGLTRENRGPVGAARRARPHQARRVPRLDPRRRAAHRPGRVDQQRLRGARAPRRGARDVPRVRRADVRPAGARVPGRHHPRDVLHDGPREHQPVVQRDRAARGASLDVAPRQQPREDEGLHEAEHLPRRHPGLLPRPPAVGPRRRRDAARRHRGPLRQRHERRQHPQQLQRAGGGGRRGPSAGSRATGTSSIRRARRSRTCR